MKILFALIPIGRIWSGHNFASTMTTQLSCHVQNCDLTYSQHHFISVITCNIIFFLFNMYPNTYMCQWQSEFFNNSILCFSVVIILHWFRWWLGTNCEPSHYLNQWWPVVSYTGTFYLQSQVLWPDVSYFSLIPPNLACFLTSFLTHETYTMTHPIWISSHQAPCTLTEAPFTFNPIMDKQSHAQ